MIKVLVVAASLVVGMAAAQSYAPLTQEQLAQFVAAQQRSSPVAVAAASPRRLVLQRQPLHQQPAPQGQPEGDEGDGAAPPHPYYQQQADLRKYRLGPEQQPRPDDYDPNPQYQFSFDIKDDESTNYHNRKETRDGDKISGSYSVVDSDGYIRTVTYTADPQEGFKADVNRQPTDIVVKLPKHPSRTPGPGLPLSPQLQLIARKQQTQQYLQASSPAIDGGENLSEQYSPHQQGQLYTFQPQPQPQPQRAAVAVAPQGGSIAYITAPQHRLSPVPKAPKSYSAQPQPLLYRAAAYQQQ